MRWVDTARYLQDILDNARLARGLVEGMTDEQFAKDQRTILAVERAIEIIGEATKHVPDSYRQRSPTSRGERWRACATSSATNTGSLNQASCIAWQSMKSTSSSSDCRR